MLLSTHIPIYYSSSTDQNLLENLFRESEKREIKIGFHKTNAYIIQFWQYIEQWNYEIFNYGILKYSKNTFLFLFSNKMLVIRAEIYKMLVRIANREDSDLTSDMGLSHLSGPLLQATLSV